jgi:hypothetical protein
VVHVCALARLLMDVSAAAEVFRTLLYTSHVRRARQQLRYARTAAGGKRRASALHLAARHARVTMRIAAHANEHAAQDAFGVLGPIGNTIYMSPSMRFLTGFEGREMAGCACPRLGFRANRTPRSATTPPC